MQETKSISEKMLIIGILYLTTLATTTTMTSPSTQEFLNSAAQFGISQSEYLFSIKEPELYAKGLWLTKDDPGLGVAAFNYQQAHTKDLSKYGYASLEASALLSKRLSLNRNTVGALRRVSVRQTSLYEECPVKSETVDCPAYSLFYRTFDGTCNNRRHPTWGSAFRPFQRFLPPVYEDGIQSFRHSVTGDPLPSPRTVSALIHRHVNTPPSQYTTMLMQWGQFLDHDITSSSQTRGFNGSIPKCCLTNGRGSQPVDLRHPDCAPISVPSDDPFYGPFNLTCLEFVRSNPAPHDDCVLGPRDQINQITSFIDASNVYGSTEEAANELRLYKLGKLKYKDMLFRKSLLPPLSHVLEGECREPGKNLHCFHGGDMRTNEQPGLSAMHAVWLREHNRIATRLSILNPHWSDERVYHEGRKIVAAEMQHITYNEWLPLILGDKVLEVFDLKPLRRGFYDGYNESVNPSAANAFGTAAFRFGHSLVPVSLNRCDRRHKPVPGAVKLRKELMDPTPIHNIGGVDRLMLGMCSQPAMKRDEFISEELTNHLFQTSKKPFGMDLISINLQRGRDHGLPPYTVWREQCGLTPITNWGQLLSIMDDDTVGRLRIAYEHVDDIDLFTGGMAEKPVIGGVVGPTFACILGQQFLNLKQGDRFWYELGGQTNSFTENQLREIRKATLSRVVCDNLDDVETVQPWLFLLPHSETNPRVSCQGSTIPRPDLSAWMETEVKAPPLHAISDSIPTLIMRSNVTGDTESFEVPDMPRPMLENEYVTDLPSPLVETAESKEEIVIAENLESLIAKSTAQPLELFADKLSRSSARRSQSQVSAFERIRASAFKNKLFYGR